ncbi:MAG: hypothetical protein J0L93_09495 [Deltaproteobacteria bacterium]|nr:hypothetical protein [Deltaproteobacteria bacterium]
MNFNKPSFSIIRVSLIAIAFALIAIFFQPTVVFATVTDKTNELCVGVPQVLSKNLEWDQKFSAAGGGIEVLQEMFLSFTANFDAKNILIELLEGVPDEIRTVAIQEIEDLNMKARDGPSAIAGTKRAQIRMAKAVKIVIEAHRNSGRKLAKETPSDKVGFAKLIAELPYVKNLEWAKKFSSVIGGVMVLKKTSPYFTDFTRNFGAKNILIGLLMDLPLENRNQATQEIENLNMSAREGELIRMGRLNAQKRMRKAIMIVIAAHKKAGKKFPNEIPADKEGFEKIMRIIKARVRP